jgi:hypothetical protein
MKEKDKMQLHVIFGRSQTGKTGRLIEEMNACRNSALIFSLENSESHLRKRGLQNSVPVLEDLNLKFIGSQTKTPVKVVGLDNLELLDHSISISNFCSRLKSAGVDRFVVTCHLRRDFRPASEERLIGVSFSSETL